MPAYTKLYVRMQSVPDDSRPPSRKTQARKPRNGFALKNRAVLQPFARARAENMILILKIDGAPEKIRTSDLQLRRLPLYPAELRARASLSSLHAELWPINYWVDSRRQTAGKDCRILRSQIGPQVLDRRTHRR